MPQLSYSGDLVRRHDRDRFLASLFAPAARRPGLWALYAFNYEIARTREVVSDTTLGLIRLQWWRDAFAAIYDGRPVPTHEILRDLEPAIRQYKLPRAHFDNLLYAREFDLEDVAPGNLQGLENYVAFTGGPLLELALRIAGEPFERMAPVAQAYGLAGIIRAVPFLARQNRCFLPLNLMALEGFTPHDLYDGRASGLEKVTGAVAGHAKGLLAQAPPKRGTGRMGRVITEQTRLWLGHIERCGNNPFSSRLEMSPPFYEFRLWLASRGMTV